MAFGPGAGGRPSASRMRAARLLATTATTANTAEGDEVLRVGDGEGVERRQEEEVVRQHAQTGRRAARRPGRRRRRWPSTPSQEQQRHAGHAGQLPPQQQLSTPSATATASTLIARLLGFAPGSRSQPPGRDAARRPPSPRTRRRVGQHVNMDAAGAADDALGGGAADHQLRPMRAAGGRDGDVGEVVGAGVVHHRRPPRRRRGWSPLSAPSRSARRSASAVAGWRACVAPAALLDTAMAVQGPRSPSAMRRAWRISASPPSAPSDVHQQALAGAPRAADRVAPHVGDHLVVHTLRRAAQRQFPQRGQVAGLEVVLHRPRRLVRNVDLALRASRWIRSAAG